MFMDLLRRRRSTRRFLDRPVEPEKLDLLVEAALRAPSSRGVNPWELVVVTERDLLSRLAQSKEHGSSFLKDAPAGIVMCADSRKSDVWVEDASIATILVQIAAESIDLGTCWVQIRQRPHSPDRAAQDYVAELLSLPSGIMVEAIVAVGYAAERKPGHPAEDLLWRQVHRGRFGRAYRPAS